MSATATLRTLVLGLSCLALAACGNAPGREVTVTSITQRLLKGRSAPAPQDANLVARAAATALANTTGQVLIVSIPERDALTVMQEIERNGDYITFGTPDRRSITLKHGVMTATRGLGYDLMSADVEAVSPLIRARNEGSARRVNRYLDGENLTTELSPWCQIKLSGGAQVTLGEVNSPGTVVLESCITGGTTFQNSYVVSPAGRILQSRQWLSPLNGYMTIQPLR